MLSIIIPSTFVHTDKSCQLYWKYTTDPSKGLLAYRSTPLACGYSPAELLMGRKLRNSIRTFHTILNSSWPDMDKLREREAGSKETQRLNPRHNAIPLKSVQPGTPVHIKDMGTTSTVTGAAETLRFHCETKPFPCHPNPYQQASVSQCFEQASFT